MPQLLEVGAEVQPASRVRSGEEAKWWHRPSLGLGSLLSSLPEILAFADDSENQTCTLTSGKDHSRDSGKAVIHLYSKQSQLGG